MTAATAEYEKFDTFGEAADAVLRMMQQLLALDVWLVSRVHADEWIVLHAFGSGDFAPGDVIPLKNTICSEMIAGHGPNVAPDIAQIFAYARAAVARSEGIGSYAGAPLMIDGRVYGVLCGISREAGPAEMSEQTPHLITAARTLSTILSQQLETEALQRRVERAENEALVDELTGLYNRRGWEQLVAHELARGRRYGHKHTLFYMDIDGLKELNDRHGHDAGDVAIVRTADAIRSVVREHDVAARLGGDEFALLAVETDGTEGAAVAKRLGEAFRRSGVSVSIGSARSENAHDLGAVTRAADEAMYRRKGDRRAS